jgi:hypothetical protein
MRQMPLDGVVTAGSGPFSVTVRRRTPGIANDEDSAIARREQR